MDSLTLDTTVLAKGIIPPRRKKKDPLYEEQFRLYSIAKALLQKVEDKKSIMHVPSVAVVEMAAVGARLTGKDERGIQASDYVKAHGAIVHDSELMDESVKIAVKTRASGFDNLFIACAKITGSMLITDDKKMHDAAVKIGVPSRLLRAMGH